MMRWDATRSGLPSWTLRSLLDGHWRDAIGIGAQHVVTEHAISRRFSVFNPHHAGVAIPIDAAVKLGEVARWQIARSFFNVGAVAKVPASPLAV